MRRLAIVLCLLSPSAVFAGETRGQLQVGITITGKSGSSTISPKILAGATNGAAESPPQSTLRAGAGSPNVLGNTVPSIR